MAIAKAERLMNLALCLLGARRPLTKRELRASIEAYVEAFGSGTASGPGEAATGSEESFSRMFERDKDDLRELGLVIDPVENLDGRPPTSPAATATACRPSPWTPPRPPRSVWPPASGSRPGSPPPPAAPSRSCTPPAACPASPYPNRAGNAS